MHYVVNKNPDVGTGRTKANHGITQDDETSMRCSASRAYNCSEIIAVSVFIRLPHVDVILYHSQKKTK